MCCPTLTITQLCKFDFVLLLSFFGRTVFEKDMWFVMLAHDFRNTPRAKFQNQLSFRICYHNLPETFITTTLLSDITTFVNTIVRQLMDLTDPLSATYYLLFLLLALTLLRLIFLLKSLL